ncbi:MAG: hypothetical protein RL040_959 [Bacteroidota bacterium]|jgi:hypothetical protein
MLLILPAAAQVPSYVPTDGLVGWWPFCGNANDESGNGHHGNVNNATLIQDRFGIVESAFSFDGIDDFIQIPHHTSLNSLPFSVTFWMKSSGQNGFSKILNKACCSSWNGWDIEIVSAPSSVANWHFEYYNAPCQGIYQTYCSPVPYPSIESHNDLWHHCVFTVDSTQAKVYWDGILALEQTWDGPPIAPSSSIPLDIARYGQGNFGFYSGLLDDVGIWNKALTESEIQSLFNGSSSACAAIENTNCPSLPSNLQQGLVGYWPFCGNANDESGNGNNGTVNGATLTVDRFGNDNQAYSFDGINNHIVVENPVNLPIGNSSRTFSCWFNYQTSIQPPIYNDWNSLICYGEFGTNDCNSNYLLLNNDQSVLFASAGGSCVGLNSDTTNILNSWHFVTVTFSDNIIKIFIDGQLLTEGVNNSLNTSITNLFFGIYNNQVQADQLYSLRGKIDDIGIWNRALTPEEVQELYTLDACTFTVYDTTYVTVYDTLTTYETVYDTLYTYETIYDTVTTYVTVTDTLLIDITFTGFEGQPSWLNTVTVFPNPASDHITIDYGNFALMAGYNTVITDAAGATVYSSAVNSQQAYIDINAWGAAGVYYMTIYDASGAAVAVRHIVLE